MAHRTAHLNVFGRQLLVNRVLLEGWSMARAAEAHNVSRTTIQSLGIRASVRLLRPSVRCCTFRFS